MYGDLPLPKSPFGEKLYESGCRLVEEHDLDLGQIVWDADEVLWDWVMHFGRMLRSVTQLVRRDFTHREYFRVKPGIMELIWGMHHAALGAGRDPWLRVWTDGYPWRTWQISRQIPGLADLFGPIEGHDIDSHGAFIEHPNIFSRTDFSAAAELAIEWYANDPRLQRLPHAVRQFVAERIEREQVQATWKLPELAEWIGKFGFRRSAVLIDDKRRNARAFAATGRRAIHVLNPTPHVVFGKVPNSVWFGPEAQLERLSSRAAEGVAEALSTVMATEPGTIVEVDRQEPAPPQQAVHFELEIPDARIRAEWLEPVKRLKARLNGG